MEGVAGYVVCREDRREKKRVRETEEKREKDDERQGRGREVSAGWEESQGRWFVGRTEGGKNVQGTEGER